MWAGSQLDPNGLFTSVIALMWWLYERADEEAGSAVRDDLLVAINELEMGPWLHRPAPAQEADLPFTIMCGLLDVMLEELARITPRLAGRVAVTRARRQLSGDRPQGLLDLR